MIAGASAADIATRPMLVIEIVSSAIPGDANGDGVVDVADLGVVGTNFGNTPMQQQKMVTLMAMARSMWLT